VRLPKENRLTTEADPLESFRADLREFLEANCPKSLRTLSENPPTEAPTSEDRKAWLDAMASRGYTTPTWPKEYGGGGLSKAELRVLNEELGYVGAYAPSVSFFGTAMLAPVLLEFGNEEQKKEHLSAITRGDIAWCQGYSEPGAGSDLAGLQTRAVLDGDHYIINGSKIWTTQANVADWIFCLVRTDPDAAKHDGISFILFDLKSPGVTISPIELISGSSEFCQVFFEDVRADAKNLVGPLNGGWTIAKRLLQHERQTLSGGMGGAGGPIPIIQSKKPKKKVEAAKPLPASSYLAEAARPYVGAEGEKFGDRLGEAEIRGRIAQFELDSLCFGLSMRRSGEEGKAGKESGAATSMFKLYASEMNKRRLEIQMSVRGANGLGWEGDGFEAGELSETRGWLRSKGNSIEGGTSEVQLNVIAKRVLGLPD
jgi:alkylation response protein AidB-like acyl-CoA dehydrogenase